MNVRGHVAIAMVAAASLFGAVAGARADSAHIATADSFSGSNLLPAQNRWNAQATHRTFQWDEKGHWSLKLDMTQPIGRDMQLQDVQAGAYYRLTPSLRVGGAVSLGDAASLQPANPSAPPPSQAPRVRLETNFKF